MKYYILKNKNKRFKIIAIVLLILSRFETNFGSMGYIPYKLYQGSKNDEKPKVKVIIQLKKIKC